MPHYVLSSHGTRLGTSGAELGGLATGTRGWHFLPTPEFETVRPLLVDLQRATASLQELMPTAETLAAVREEEQGAFIRNAMLSDPGAERFLELMEAMEQLALQLHDDAGALVPTRTLGVTELDLEPADFREVLRAIDPNADPALSAQPPFYLLVAGMG